MKTCNRATTTRHMCSRWWRPGNLKTKTSVLEIYLVVSETNAFIGKIGNNTYVKIMFSALKLFFLVCFSAH